MSNYSNNKLFLFLLICIVAKMFITVEPVGVFHAVFTIVLRRTSFNIYIMSFSPHLIEGALAKKGSLSWLRTEWSLVGIVYFDSDVIDRVFKFSNIMSGVLPYIENADSVCYKYSLTILNIGERIPKISKTDSNLKSICRHDHTGMMYQS